MAEKHMCILAYFLMGGGKAFFRKSKVVGETEREKMQ